MKSAYPLTNRIHPEVKILIEKAQLLGFKTNSQIMAFIYGFTNGWETINMGLPSDKPVFVIEFSVEFIQEHLGWIIPLGQDYPVYLTLEEEILRVRKNEILSKYLMDTQQSITFISEGGNTFVSNIDPDAKTVSQGGFISDPEPLHPAQSVCL